MKRLLFNLVVAALAGVGLCAVLENTAVIKVGTVWQWLSDNDKPLLILLTGGLAGATYGLFKDTAAVAAETRGLARASLSQIDQAERHHQEQSRALLVVKRPRLILRNPTISDGTTVTRIAGQVASVLFGAEITNMGNGRAVTAKLTFTRKTGQGIQISLGAIAAGTDLVSTEWDLRPFIESGIGYKSLDGTEVTLSYTTDANADGYSEYVYKYFPYHEWLDSYDGAPLQFLKEVPPPYVPYKPTATS